MRRFLKKMGVKGLHGEIQLAIVHVGIVLSNYISSEKVPGL